MLVSVLGACGAKEISGEVDIVESETVESSKPSDMFTEELSDEISNTEVEDTENEKLSDVKQNEVKVLTLEARVTDYYDNGETEVISEYEYDTKGNIAKGKEHTIRADGSESENERMCENEYDEKGNLIVSECYGQYGNFILRKEWKYDQYGNVVEYADTEREGEAALKQEEWKYDEKGNMIEYARYSTSASVDEDGNISFATNIRERQELIYDENNNHIKSTYYDGKGNISSTDEMKYDENGNQIEFVRCGINDSFYISREWKYGYDENGNIIEVEMYDSYGDLSCIEKRKYDENGNQIQCIYYNSNGEQYANEEWKYDEEGNLVEYTKYEDGIISRHAEYLTIEVSQ